MELENNTHLKEQLGFLDMLRLAAQFQQWLDDPALDGDGRAKLVDMIQDLLTAAKEVGPGWKRPEMERMPMLTFMAEQLACSEDAIAETIQHRHP